MNLFGEITKAFLEGVAEAAQHLNEKEAKLREQERALRQKEKDINITITQTPQHTRHVVVREQPQHVVVTQQATSEIRFGYSIEELAGMSTEELRNEVKSISREYSSIFSSNYQLGSEANTLYYDSSRNYSETRYRAKLIKFLLEKGNI